MRMQNRCAVQGLARFRHSAFRVRRCRDFTGAPLQTTLRLWDWSSQSRRSAVLKGHCWLALAQHASAVRRRRHLLTETMRDDAAHQWRCSCRSALPGIAKVPFPVKRCQNERCVERAFAFCIFRARIYWGRGIRASSPHMLHFSILTVLRAAKSTKIPRYQNT